MTPVAERRVCSVLFADLVGFTTLSERRDPEEVRELLSQYFATARTVITRYGGTVEKFIGDAVMAVWGTPVASEGDAERAVRAALDLVSAVAALGDTLGAPGLALRAGVVTGPVAVTLGAVGEGMVAGDAVNTAARVQAAAHPGTVWVDSATQRLASAAVGFRDAGEHALKGKAEPVRLWEATRVLSSVGGAQRVDGLEAPMTGRDPEFRTLRELFHACVERRMPRLVTISGGAGAGKSRLGWEFEKYSDGLAEEMWWHRGRCLSYGEGVAFWALAEAVRQRFGISAEDSVDEAVAKFLAGLAQHLDSERERTFVGIRLGRLLGLVHPDDTGADLARDDLSAGWRVLFERMADSAPVVLIIEDAQHADDGLLDFVEHLVEWSRQSPIFVLLLGRSELIQRRPGLAGGRNRSSIVLDPLDERSMRQLVSALVSGMPAEAVSSIVEQSQGNPLFAVETVRSLIDRDVIVPADGEYRLVGDIGTLTVPDTLHAVLAARLDVLDPSLRALVADASVLGTSFPADALVAISGRTPADVMTGLADLVRREVLDVSTDPLSPERGSYLFSQNMLRQVAYDTLSRRDRRARHLAVAEHLRTVFTGGGDEIMEVIARHYVDALEAASDDTDAEVRAKAVDSLVRAGERSLRAGAPTRAAASFVRAADLAEADDRRAAAALCERAGQAFGSADALEDALAVDTRAREIYLAENDTRAAARALASTGQWLFSVGRVSEGRATFETALVDLRSVPDADTVDALAGCAACMTFLNESDARGLADEALLLAQQLDLPKWRLAKLFGTRGVAASLSRRTHDARADLQYARELAARAGDRAQEARALVNLADVELSVDAAASADAAREAARICLATGYRYMLGFAIANLGLALFVVGEWDAALDETGGGGYGEDAAEIEYVAGLRALLQLLRGDQPDEAVLALPRMRASDDVQDVAFIGAVAAAQALKSGRAPEARDGLAALLADDTSVLLSAPEVEFAWALAFRLAVAAGDLAEARRLVALVEARPVGELPERLRGALDVARATLARHDGRPADEVAAAYVDAVRRVRAAGNPHLLAHALLDRADFLHATGGDVSETTALVDEARAIGTRLRAIDVRQRTDVLDARRLTPAN